MTAVAFVVAAMVGGLARWAAIRWWRCSWQSLLAVNVAGSALLSWLIAADVGSSTLTIVGAGFAGSLTTFSAFALEVIDQRPRFAAIYVALTARVCLGAASIAATL